MYEYEFLMLSQNCVFKKHISYAGDCCGTHDNRGARGLCAPPPNNIGYDKRGGKAISVESAKGKFLIEKCKHYWKCMNRSSSATNLSRRVRSDDFGLGI